jgi:FemAB-related protein (PEP-CTERM system-associated)
MRALHRVMSDARPLHLASDGPGSVVTWRDGASWDRFVDSCEGSTVAHRWAWTEIVPDAYRHRVLPLAAVRDGSLVGVLPLTVVSSSLFGTALVSMPYLDTGGICTADDWARSVLVCHALAEAGERGARLELRHRYVQDVGLHASLAKVTLTIPLDEGRDAVWARVKPNRRSQVRKAERNGLTTVLAGPEGMGAFHHVMSVNMRDLGSPMHRRSFFGAVARALGDDARFVLVRSREEVLAAGLMLFHGGTAILPWSSCLRSARSTGANQLLYWSVAEHALARGCHTLDLGRSSPGSGTYEAKREWGARPAQLYWYRNPGHADPVSPEDGSRAMQLGVRAWKHLPVPVATPLGALIRGGLPQ